MACDEQYAIAKQGKLPWYCPEDISFYRATIKNQIVVMGHKTYQQMPVDFFENHTTVVLSKHAKQHKNTQVTFVSSLDEFFKLENLPSNKECYMIGGAETTRLFLEKAAIEHFYLTEIEGNYQGDLFFPIELMSKFKKAVYLKGPGFTIYHYTLTTDIDVA